VVVAELDDAGDFPADRQDVRDEAIRSGDAGHDEHLGPGRHDHRIARLGDVARRPDGPRHAEHRRDPEGAADPLGGGVVARGDQRGVRHRRGADALAQPPGRHRLILKVVLGDEQQIDVARQLEMLKAVVQHVHGGAEPAFRQPPRQIAVAPDQHADAGERAGEHQRLVAGVVEVD
jgi:hypothetical protein